MSYDPPFLTESAYTLLGNPTLIPVANPLEITLNSPISFSGGLITAPPPAGRSTSGNATLLLSDYSTSMISTGNSGAVYTLPIALPNGYWVRSFQKGSGQITYTPAVGANLLNSTSPIRSKGAYTNGYSVLIQNLGNNNWLITGDIA